MRTKNMGTVETVLPVPVWIQILGWLISLSAFAVGFWHAHLGLRQFQFLSSEYGSFVIAGLILMVLIVVPSSFSAIFLSFAEYFVKVSFIAEASSLISFSPK